MSVFERKSFLFTVRIWAEPVGENQIEWRGKIQSLPDGEAFLFRDWSGLIDRLQTILAHNVENPPPLSGTDTSP